MAAFPLHMLGPGPKLAIVTIDSTKENVFTPAMLDEGLTKVISPYLQLIALIRLSNHPEESDAAAAD